MLGVADHLQQILSLCNGIFVEKCVVFSWLTCMLKSSLNYSHEADFNDGSDVKKQYLLIIWC